MSGWALKTQIAPNTPSPYLQLSQELGFKACNGDPANLASTPGWPTGVILFCKSYIDVAGVVSALETNCIVPDKGGLLSGVFVGLYDSLGPSSGPGSLLGVTSDLSATIAAFPNTGTTGGKLPGTLVTPTIAQVFGAEVWFATLCAAQAASPVYTSVGARQFGTNGSMASNFRLLKSTATNFATLPSTAPSGANIQSSNSSYIGVGAR